jgi:hypothetical protein
MTKTDGGGREPERQDSVPTQDPNVQNQSLPSTTVCDDHERMPACQAEGPVLEEQLGEEPSSPKTLPTTPLHTTQPDNGIATKGQESGAHQEASCDEETDSSPLTFTQSFSNLHRIETNMSGATLTSRHSSVSGHHHTSSMAAARHASVSTPAGDCRLLSAPGIHGLYTLDSPAFQTLANPQGQLLRAQNFALTADVDVLRISCREQGMRSPVLRAYNWGPFKPRFCVINSG